MGGSSSFAGTVVSVTENVLMVTGPRSLRFPGLVRERLLDVVERFAPVSTISGGAEGADSLFAEVSVQAGVPLVLFLPNRFYRRRYPASCSDELVAAAAEVRVVVDRPEVPDWSRRWDAERFFVDNFVRNAAMVAASTDAVVVSAEHPRVLLSRSRGGTVAAVKELARKRPERRVIWVPDDRVEVPRWCSLR